MALPGGLVGELAHRMGGQSANDRPGQGMLAHVGERRVIDDVVGVSGAQQVEEVQPALAAGGAEPGEPVVADLRADAVGAAMARAGVVHRDPGRRLQPGAQNLAGLRQEAVLLVGQQAHDLPLGDADADRPQQRRPAAPPSPGPGDTASARSGAVPARNGRARRRAAAPGWSRPSGVSQRSRR